MPFVYNYHVTVIMRVFRVTLIMRVFVLKRQGYHKRGALVTINSMHCGRGSLRGGIPCGVSIVCLIIIVQPGSDLDSEKPLDQPLNLTRTKHWINGSTAELMIKLDSDLTLINH